MKEVRPDVAGCVGDGSAEFSVLAVGRSEADRASLGTEDVTGFDKLGRATEEERRAGVDCVGEDRTVAGADCDDDDGPAS